MKHRLPAISADKYDAVDGVMISYGGDSVEPFRIASFYVNRIQRGAKIDELPMQFPTKFELVINLEAAKAIGLTIPAALLLRADELIE